MISLFIAVVVLIEVAISVEIYRNIGNYELLTRLWTEYFCNIVIIIISVKILNIMFTSFYRMENSDNDA